MELYEEIYYSLIGVLSSEAALPWVPNAFSPGSSCEQAEALLYKAKQRIEKKLCVDEDPDLEDMMAAMDTIQQELCIAVMKLRRM